MTKAEILKEIQEILDMLEDVRYSARKILSKLDIAHFKLEGVELDDSFDGLEKKEP